MRVGMLLGQLQQFDFPFEDVLGIAICELDLLDTLDGLSLFVHSLIDHAVPLGNKASDLIVFIKLASDFDGEVLHLGRSKLLSFCSVMITVKRSQENDQDQKV